MRQQRLVRLVHSLLLTGACASLAAPAFAQTPKDTIVANAGGQVPSPTAPLGIACTPDRTPARDNPSEVKFNTSSELQGIYDAVSQVEIPFGGNAEDLYATVYFAPGWTFVDLAGQKQSWAEKRARDLSERLAAPWESRIQRIHSLTILPDGAATVVYVTTLRTGADTERRKGVCGALIREEAVYSDTWVKVADKWMMASRAEARPLKVTVDKRW